MATPTGSSAREQLLALAKGKKKLDLTATELGRMLGIVRQRAQVLADEEGIELAKWKRATTPIVELHGTTERAKRTLDLLRRHIDEAQAIERDLAQRIREAEKKR